METRCPCCGSSFSLEVALNDEAGAELLALFAKNSSALTRPLVAYLGLFRPAARKLSWPRALKLTEEVLAMSTEAHLALALSETLEALREKQQSPGWKPLRNHNYLKRVLESVEASTVVLPDQRPQEQATPRKLSKHAEAILQLGQ